MLVYIYLVIYIQEGGGEVECLIVFLFSLSLGLPYLISVTILMVGKHCLRALIYSKYAVYIGAIYIAIPYLYIHKSLDGCHCISIVLGFPLILN